VAFSSIYQISILLWYFRKKYVVFQWGELFFPQVKHFIAALCMGIVLYFIQTELQWKGMGAFTLNALILLSLVIGGILIYASLCYVLKAQEFFYLLQRLLRKMRSR